ncbi:unnamed protein product, partial [Schistosoma turkestanicum]
VNHKIIDLYHESNFLHVPFLKTEQPKKRSFSHRSVPFVENIRQILSTNQNLGKILNYKSIDKPHCVIYHSFEKISVHPDT